VAVHQPEEGSEKEIIPELGSCPLRNIPCKLF